MSLYNMRNPAVKRLMKEAEELKHPTEEYYAQPLEDNLFEWHFTLRGPPGTEFEGGIYHGRITLPPDYPMKPPSIILLTPNGRFETNKKICLSISGHHPESWQPSWSIRTALLAIIGFLPTHGNGAIGSLDYTPEERKLLALKSQDWKCPECGFIRGCLKNPETQSSENCDVPIEDSMQSEHNETVSSNDMLSNEDSLEKHIVDTETVKNLADSDENHSEHIPISSIEDRDVIPQEENEPVLRQRNVACSHSSQASHLDVVRPEHSNEDRHVQSYCSLLVIWCISLILVILIVRRWLYYDYSL